MKSIPTFVIPNTPLSFRPSRSERDGDRGICFCHFKEMAIMTTSPQNHDLISTLNRLAASAALAFAVVLVSAVVMPQAAHAQTVITLYSFCLQGGCPSGNFPESAPVQGIDGNFYGTAPNGGANNNASLCKIGCGTVYKITAAGALTTLYSFCSFTNCADGFGPIASPVLATDGNFYGTTPYGGTGSNCSTDFTLYGCGTVFKITPKGKLTTIYSFCSLANCADGASPQASLVQGVDGNLYGTAQFGGANGKGTVFRITPSGTLTTLYSFCAVFVVNCNDGAEPGVGLVQATNGNFYGSTMGGQHNDGTIFEITPAGTLSTLHTFHGAADGQQPSALRLASDGKLYGTTFAGGAGGSGTVFSMTLSGTFTTLYNFCTVSGCSDGFDPSYGVVPATDGNLYGSDGGGPNGGGDLFKITPSGTFTTLYSFCAQSNCTDGAHPVTMTQSTNGNFYGTTNVGGTNGDGTVFSLSTGLGQFVKTVPAGATVGKRVGILGTDLTGATSVTFNGTPSTFTVVSNTLITTTVPTGATTGTVQVVTPSGTLSSNATFVVIP
jgi:uncharacterized repeat protein (TIGR03803 family)